MSTPYRKGEAGSTIRPKSMWSSICDRYFLLRVYDDLRNVDPRETRRMRLETFSGHWCKCSTTCQQPQTSKRLRWTTALVAPSNRQWRKDLALHAILMTSGTNYWGRPVPTALILALSPAKGKVNLPTLVGQSSNVPRSLLGYAAATESAISSKTPTASCGKKRPRQPSSD